MTWKERIEATQEVWRDMGDDFAERASGWARCACCQDEIGYIKRDATPPFEPLDDYLVELGEMFSAEVAILNILADGDLLLFEKQRKVVERLYEAIHSQAKAIRKE